MVSKEAIEVATNLYDFCQAYGVPAIAQMDNGTEFKEVLEALLRAWGIRIIHGRAHWPQSQGHVERAEWCFENKA